MSYTQRPCVCGGTTFYVLPNIQVAHGLHGSSMLAAYTWSITAVVCTLCTRTEMFTNNADQVATHVQARTINAGPQ